MTHCTSTKPETFDSREVTASAIKVLTIGWRLSFALIIIGLIIAIVRDEPLTSELGTFGHVLDELLTGHSNGFLGLGILVMILSPIVSSATIALNFFRIGDRRYGFITAAVFAVLVVSIALSLL
jgi:uncharacterized membrane protein